MQIDWIAVDWGTTRLRAWAMDAAGTVLARGSSDKGMGGLSPEDFEPALLDLIAPWIGAGTPPPVVACGMVGARQGWIEARYCAVPCPPVSTGTLKIAPTTHAGLRVAIAGGLSQAAPADVMRGEETQIAGYIAGSPDFDGVLCLPGTHTKWARISAGEVVSFATYMTGELFGLLAERSVLRHSVTSDGWDEAAFLDAVSDAISKPQLTATRLFSLRAQDLLDGTEPHVARSRLSGLLIGIELAGSRPYWLGTKIGIIGADGLSSVYALALRAQGTDAAISDAETMTLKGLTAARAQLKDMS